MDKAKLINLTKNELFVAIAGAIVSGIITYIVTVLTASGNPMIERYFAIDTASTLIDSYLVDMDYVDSAILEEESLDQQFKIIHDSFAEYDNAVQEALVNMGQDQSAVSEMNRYTMLAQLPNAAEELYDKCDNKDKQIEQLNSRITALEKENMDLQNQVDDYKQRKEAELIASKLIVDGELMNNGEPINKAIAKVDGNYYYSQAFLNAHVLSDQIYQDSQDDTIVVGNAKPEKVKFSWDIVTNSDGVGVYTPGGGGSFVLDTKSYSEGLVLTGTDYFYAYLGGKYSKLTFTYGHVDNTCMYDLELTIFALDANNEEYTLLKTIPLKATLACKDIEISLGYATKIKVVMSGWVNYDSQFATQYGLTDIYFYS